MDVFLQTLEGWVYIVSIHGPLDGPLYMGSHIHQHYTLLFSIITGLNKSVVPLAVSICFSCLLFAPSYACCTVAIY